MKSIITALLLSVSFGALAANDIDMKVEAALAAESRPEADRDRDRNRRPLDTLNFFGMTDDMRVLELLPGGGWYSKLLAPTLRDKGEYYVAIGVSNVTRVLAPVLADNGKLYVALGSGRVEENLMGTPGFEKVEALATDENLHRPAGERFYAMDEFEFGVSDLDMVLTFRNLHNFGSEARGVMNQQVFKALKNGGLYGVVDHTRRHMEAAGGENRRRIDPVLVIKEMLDVGFEFVDYSDLHYRADDELEYEVGRRSVGGNTDRFTMLFRKP